MNRFDELLERFEGLLNRFEGTEGAPTGSSASFGQAGKKEKVHSAIKEFDDMFLPQLDKFVNLGKTHANKIVHEVSELGREAFMLIRAILLSITQSKHQKTSDLAIIISPHIKELDNKIAKKMKDLDVKNHCKSILDSLQLIQITIMDDPHDMGKEFLAQIDFYGNKVLQLRKEPDTEW